MSKQTPNNDKNLNTALWFTALMGVVVALISIYTSKYGDSSTTDALRFIALAGTMIGGVVMALLYYASGKK